MFLTAQNREKKEEASKGQRTSTTLSANKIYGFRSYISWTLNIQVKSDFHRKNHAVSWLADTHVLNRNVIANGSRQNFDFVKEFPRKYHNSKNFLFSSKRLEISKILECADM